jgi:formylglycine-generating enzyme required for sulfatase activity
MKMKKVFILLAAALLAEGAFGEELSNIYTVAAPVAGAPPTNGAEVTCTIAGVPFTMVFVEGSGSVSDFWIGQFEVTQQQWLAVWGSFTQTQDHGSGNDFPVYYVSWNDAQEFIKRLNDSVGGGNFRLPTEAEWEYAARGGSANDGTTYAGSNTVVDVAWYYYHPSIGSPKGSHPVGKLAPNGINAYDMSGNVEEWCEDIYSGSYCELRGGDWSSEMRFCTVSYRTNAPLGNRRNYIGFRLACSSE